MSDNQVDKSVTTKICFKWSVNYASRLVQSELYSSAIKNLIWSMELYPRFRSNDAEDQVVINLCFISCECSFIGHIKYYILDRRGKVAHLKETNRQQFQQNGVYSTNLITCDELMTRAYVLLPNNRLTILCRLIIMDNEVATNDALLTRSRCNLIADLGNILENKKFCDIILKSKDGYKLKAHKSILAARSNVFATLLETCKHNKFYELDFDRAVCEEMLQFIYTGRVSNLDVMFMPLLEVAYKYDLAALKSLCEQKLQSLENL